MGLGFRDIRLYETTKMILNKDVDISKLNQIKDTNQVRDELLKLSGVGNLEGIAQQYLFYWRRELG